MTDDGLDGGSPAHLALNLGRHAPFLPGDEDPELIIGRRIVAILLPQCLFLLTHPKS
jgi:hypothetical protein